MKKTTPFILALFLVPWVLNGCASTFSELELLAKEKICQMPLNSCTHWEANGDFPSQNIFVPEEKASVLEILVKGLSAMGQLDTFFPSIPSARM